MRAVLQRKYQILNIKFQLHQFSLFARLDFGFDGGTTCQAKYQGGHLTGLGRWEGDEGRDDRNCDKYDPSRDIFLIINVERTKWILFR